MYRPDTVGTRRVQNLFNAPQVYYRGNPDQLQMFIMNGTTITGGIEGRF